MTDSLPNVGRPKGNAWRHLLDEGIVWEGQVLITGDDTDLAALLIVTNQRLAFVRGGVVALDIERDWLKPAPVLRRTGTVQLWISPPGTPMAEAVTFIARDGRDEAAVLLSLIGVNPTYGSAYRLPTYIPDMESEQPHVPVARSRRRRFAQPDDEFQPEPLLPVFSILDDDDFPPVVSRPAQSSAWEEAIAERLESSGPFPLVASIRNPNEPLRPIEGFDSRFTRDRRTWVIRIAGLILVFGFISVLASGILPGIDDLRDDSKRSNPTPFSIAQNDEPTRTPETAPTPTPTVTPEVTSSGPSSTLPKDPTVVPMETAVALGVGSDEPSETPTPTLAPTETPEPTLPPTETPEPVSTATEQVVAAAQATDEPASLETPIIPPPGPTESATSTPTTEPEVTETPAASETTSVVSETETAEAAAVVTGGSLRDQDASIARDEIPAQTFAMGGLRVQISLASRAESLPALTLGRDPEGEWVVVLLEAVNWSSQPVNLAMPDFRLASASDLSSELALDASTGGVASYLGLTPALRPSESSVVPPGGYQAIALVFSVPAEFGDVVLRAGEETIALDLAFANQADGELAGPENLLPAMISGEVVEIIDGQTLTIDTGGEQFTVLYYGMAGSDAGDCYATETAAANAALMEGQTVILERERRNRSETDTYLRDAWVTGDDGAPRLASAVLAGDGFGLPAPSEPDIRFAGWIAGEALEARLSGIGAWSTCELTA